MSATQELPLDLSTQFALVTTTAAVSTSPHQDYAPQQRKEKKVQRPRKAFSSLQLEELKRRFQQNPYPSRKEVAELASSLELTAFQVKTWFRNRRSIKNEKLDFECKKMTTEVQDVGGSLGILQVGGNTSLITAQPQKQELEFYGMVGHNQLTSHLKGGEGYYPQMQQEMEEAIVAATNYVYYMTYISHYTSYMNQANEDT